MAIELIRSSDLTDQVPYAYAARVTAAHLVFTAGACPLDENGEVTPVGDYAGQAARVMENLSAALAAAGAGLEDVAKTSVYVATADRADLVAVWEVVRAAFGDHDAPAPCCPCRCWATPTSWSRWRPSRPWRGPASGRNFPQPLCTTCGHLWTTGTFAVKNRRAPVGDTPEPEECCPDPLRGRASTA
jgi:enamine deaminase RidA (YjgF/YER057c/UK114 family)